MDELLTKLQSICGKEHVTNDRVDLLCYRRVEHQLMYAGLNLPKKWWNW